MDPRYSKLAKTLCGHSAKIAQGEHVLLDLSETPAEMAEALIAEISARGAYPHAEISNPRISRALALAATPERLAVAAECALEKIKKMDQVADEIRGRFGYQSIQRAFMYQDKILAQLNAKEHTVHPQAYFHG